MGAQGHARIRSVQIVYSPVYGDWQHAAEVFRGSGAFEQIAQELRSSYTLNKTVTLRARACGGDPNAYYESEEVEVIFCYELMDDLLNLIAGDLPEDTRQQRPRRPDGQPRLRTDRHRKALDHRLVADQRVDHRGVVPGNDDDRRARPRGGRGCRRAARRPHRDPRRA